MVVARLAGVSRSFTYENDVANRMITAAQAMSQVRADDRIETRTAHQEASWRERALNAVDEIATLVGSLPPSVGSSVTYWDNCESRMAPGLNRIGTVFAGKTSSFFPSGTSFYVNETNSNGDWTAHGRTSRV
ncbi:MAG TPA: hypothetical protein VKV73_27690 [Chloroflexota bacterium]|nr:hypothetical protein [Chloroflexota bacterium]